MDSGADYEATKAILTRIDADLVAFQELLPSAGGIQLMEEYTALKSVMDSPKRPCVFVLGGAKISDAFSMMRKVLEDGAADRILTAGVTGLVMLLARGIKVGNATEKFLADRDLLAFLPEARELLERWPDNYLLPIDLAFETNGKRAEMDVADGTREIWNAIADAPGYTVVGGGDTISAATKFTDLAKYSYVCTGGGAMVRFLAGKKLPLIEAMEKSFDRNLKNKEPK